MNREFFNTVSSFYDEMIGFDAGLERRMESLRNFINPGMKFAADIGCGTGLDSISLSKLGLNVNAFDPSEGMISEAEKNAADHNTYVKFHNLTLSAIPDIFDNSFDIAVSLGNTIANIPQEEISAALRKLYGIVKSGGRLLLQILNYTALLERGDRIVNITNEKSIYFVRFYDFKQDSIDFNILKFDSVNPGHRSLVTTTLYPYTQEQVTALLKKQHFRDLEIYGSLNKDKFDEKVSKDLIVSAYK